MTFRLYNNTEAIVISDILTRNGYTHKNNSTYESIQQYFENEFEIDVDKQKHKGYREIEYIDINDETKKFEFFCITVNKQQIRKEKLEHLLK